MAPGYLDGLRDRIVHALVVSVRLERRRKVAGADEQHVDAGNAGDLFDVLDPFAVLDQDDDDRLLVGRPPIIFPIAPEASGADQRAFPAFAFRIVLYGGYGALGVIAIAHLRNHDPDRADVERAKDELGIVLVGSNDRNDSGAFAGSHHVANVGPIQRSVFGIDQHKIDSVKPGHLDDVAAPRAGEHPKDELV